MVDESVVVTKLEAIHEYTKDLQEMRGIPKDEYVSDVVLQRAVERTFTTLIQACIDLAAHIRASEDLGPEGTSKRDVEALEAAGIVSADTCGKIVEAVGFPNVLVHRYGEIDHDVVYEVLDSDLRWFEQYQREVAQ